MKHGYYNQMLLLAEMEAAFVKNKSCWLRPRWSRPMLTLPPFSRSALRAQNGTTVVVIIDPSVKNVSTLVALSDSLTVSSLASMRLSVVVGAGGRLQESC